MARVLFTAVFLSIFYLAKVAIYDFTVNNGLSDFIMARVQRGTIHFTTLKPLDNLLTVLVCFFQPVLTGNDPSLGLFSIFMVGQLLAMLILFHVEGLRAGNRGKAISYMAWWGILCQLVTFAVTSPVYFLLYIYTSPVPTARGADAFTAALAVEPSQARAVIGSVTLGAILPTVLAALPSPRVVSPYTQDMFLAIWQPFPLWSGIAQLLLAHGLVMGRVADSIVPERANLESKMRHLRDIYAYALTGVALTSYGVLGYVLWTTGWEAEPTLAALGNILMPTWPWSSSRMATAERATLALLQWDMYCTSLATWTWVAYMAYQRRGVGQVVMDLAKLVMWTVVVGPIGAALAVIWGRDVEACEEAVAKLKTS
ncbi:hypothetical protein LZ30DRAFT_785940 [Colletotrichum cereale]|nr:hypothetical protein LZ30DRAFT_785940 [Colletotrichum cereale]